MGRGERQRARWLGELRAFVAERRRLVPVPDPATLDALRRAELEVELGFLKAWLTRWGPPILQERAMFMKRAGLTEPEPIVVVRGGPNVLLAMRRLVGDPPVAGEGPVVAILDEEYDEFVASHVEQPAQAYHVVCWSRFEPAADALLELARRRGLSPSSADTYRNHVNGTLWADSRGLEVENLWRWDGDRLSLVSEGIRHRRFRPSR
jgi:hypothetical protein